MVNLVKIGSGRPKWGSGRPVSKQVWSVETSRPGLLGSIQGHGKDAGALLNIPELENQFGRCGRLVSVGSKYKRVDPSRPGSKRVDTGRPDAALALVGSELSRNTLGGLF